MKIGIASGNCLLTAANGMRIGSAPALAFELWLLADRAAAEKKRGSRRAVRVVLLRHAMIHAGLIRTTRGTVYRRCAMCGERFAE